VCWCACDSGHVQPLALYEAAALGEANVWFHTSYKCGVRLDDCLVAIYVTASQGKEAPCYKVYLSVLRHCLHTTRCVKSWGLLRCRDGMRHPMQPRASASRLSFALPRALLSPGFNSTWLSPCPRSHEFAARETPTTGAVWRLLNPITRRLVLSGVWHYHYDAH
jgi:hypothetical protein